MEVAGIDGLQSLLSSQGASIGAAQKALRGRAVPARQCAAPLATSGRCAGFTAARHFATLTVTFAEAAVVLHGTGMAP